MLTGPRWPILSDVDHIAPLTAPGDDWIRAVNESLATLRLMRAVRRFSPAPVPDDLIAEIIDVARWTGSARNRQPWRVAPVTDGERRAALARLGAYATFLSDAPLVLLLAIDRELGGADAEFDAGRFAQTLMLAAHAHGLGTCPVSFFPDDSIRAATAMAGLSAPWRVRTAIAIGYPDRTPPPNHGRSAIPRGRLPIEAIAIESRS